MEMDELVVRCHRRRCYRYLWVAVSRLTRQVLGFCIANRSYKSLWNFWFSLPGDYRRKLVYTDYYEAYAAFMKRMQPFSALGSIALVTSLVTRVVVRPASWKA